MTGRRTAALVFAFTLLAVVLTLMVATSVGSRSEPEPAFCWDALTVDDLEGDCP